MSPALGAFLEIIICPPLEGGPAHRAEWVNTAAPELHLWPTLAKSPSYADNNPSTLDAFPGAPNSPCKIIIAINK